EGMEKTAAGGFKYTQASGVYNPETKTGQINFAGTAEFTGHNGQLKSAPSRTCAWSSSTARAPWSLTWTR
ncbi:MAG: HtaA domain-containing protein, partial [Rothia mucilaginosa]